MATTENTTSISLPRKPNLMSVPTHITETTKILKENGETVEIVTVTLGSPTSSFKADKSLGFTKSIAVSSNEKSIHEQSDELTVTTDEGTNDLLIAASDKSEIDSGVALLPANSIVTVLDDNHSPVNISSAKLAGQLVQVVDGADQELIVQTSGNANGMPCLV